jgi:hypothetical protein
VDFDITDQLLIRYSAFMRYWKMWEYNETVHQLFVYFKKAYDSMMWEVLYNILIEFGIPMKLVMLLRYIRYISKVRIGKHLSDSLLIQNGLKQGDALSPLLFNFVLEYAIRMVQENHVEMKFYTLDEYFNYRKN